MQRENPTLEYKQALSDTFLKTVSAYANYGTGDIIFGIADSGEVIGLAEPQEVILSIENKINNTIEPRPEYAITLNADSTVTLTVYKGLHTPYFYKNKAYKRSDSSSMTVGRTELTRLTLDGIQQNFEELQSRNQKLTFKILEKEFHEKLLITQLNEDILKTLELYSTDVGYNNAAALLADKNSFRGVDIAVFGKTINEIRFRADLSGNSLLQQLNESTEIFRQYYVFEKIEGKERIKVATIPEEAFRETLANALIHRTWDINSSITVGMFEDRIEITSPGSLPTGITMEEYLHSQLSLLRNPILGTVFFRLGYIEKFGTGIARIQAAYVDTLSTPQFSATQASIKVTLPVLRSSSSLSSDESFIFHLLDNSKRLTRLQVEEESGFTKSKTLRILNELVKKGVITKIGGGRNTHYTR